MLYIGTAKFNLRPKEVGRLTYKQFRELYEAYKDNWDLELLLFYNRMTYEQLREKKERSEEWL